MDVPHVSALLPSVLRKGRQGYSETITLVGRSTCSHVVEDSIVDCGNIVIKRQEYIHTYIHTHTNKHTIFYLAQQAPPPVGQGPLGGCCEVSRSHTTTHHSRLDSSGRMVIPSQRPLPDKTRHSQRTDIHAPRGIRTLGPSRHTP